MALPQTGIFALGNLSHAYLEFDAQPGVAPLALVAAIANLAEPRTTMGGVNLVSGFRPEIWAAAASLSAAPGGVTAFTEPVVGPDGFTMPATQHDAVLWVAGGSYDVVFDASYSMIAGLSVATLASETVGWSYHRDLDLTGFIDGTENPPVALAPPTVLVPDGTPGAGGSILLLQKWLHDSEAWTALSVAEQEAVIGRRKADSIELEDRPVTAHATRTDQDDFGKIFRRNTAYGTVSEHGTVFVGFSAQQRPLAAMLDSMAGIGGQRDALTRYTSALSGAYYFIPSLEDLATFATSKD